LGGNDRKDPSIHLISRVPYLSLGIEMTEKTARPSRDNKPRAPRKPASTAELNDLKNWLSTLELGAAKPSVKVNGSHYPTALVVVDLGQPLKQVRLNSEQSSELGQRLRRTARELLGRDASIRVSADNSHGIHWASIS
jgi:hypothetical protein